MKKYVKYFLFTAILLSGVYSCDKNEKDAEAALLSEYLKEHNITQEPTADGLYLVESGFSTSGYPDYDFPAEGDTVLIAYKGYLLADTSVVFDEKSIYKPARYAYLKDDVIPGWEEAVGMMKKNVPVLIIIPSDLAYGGDRTGIIPPYSTLIFEAKITDIIKAR
ncbi:MAG: FKBP-type peptidyl-prolyl cis-trans isomerase [Chlorobi bacterium]|nr:FKBP-type peptidyl-prolyl cis-trans isomerase [Chlorobiota bacterium]